MKKLIFATHNQNKVLEIKELIPEWKVLSLADLDFHDEIPETADTLDGNAAIKAHTIFEKFKLPVFADDTGLEVKALNGAPGVYSARYAGEPADSEKNIEKLLHELSQKENRQARFKTVICFLKERGYYYFWEGTVEGEILKQKKGKNGFGYDPVFRPTGFDKTFAEMDASQKNELSHRGKAVRQFVRFLSNVK